MDIKEIAALTVAKVELLKLKSDHYNWNALMSDLDRNRVIDTLLYIDELMEDK